MRSTTYPQAPAEPEPVEDEERGGYGYATGYGYERGQPTRKRQTWGRGGGSRAGGGVLGDPHTDRDEPPLSPTTGGKSATVLGTAFAAQQQHKRPDGAPPLFTPPTY